MQVLLQPHAVNIKSIEKIVMIETPIYLYGTDELPDVDDGALYHYTKFDSFLKIIETMTLRSTPLAKMNDLNEASVEFVDWNRDFLLLLQAEKHIKNDCSVICFTKNYMTEGVCQEGGNHPAMWAHYADDSNGVCIVLDEKALIENNKDLLSEYFHKIEDVCYYHKCSPDDSIVEGEYSNVSDFLQKNYKELFFKKHVDWSYEKETRLLIESTKVYLNIKGAIKFIILGGRMKNDEDKVNEILDLMITPGSQVYKYFIPQSFAQVSRSPFGYFIDGASHIFYHQLEEMSHTSLLAKIYLNWFNYKK